MNENPISNPFDEDEKSGRRPFVWAVLGLIAMCLGVFIAGAFFLFKPDMQSLIDEYFPSPTATLPPTPTSTPTPNPTIVAYQAAADYAANNWNVIITDTFENNANDWLLESSDDEFASTNYEIVDGKYRWEATAHQAFIGWVRPDMETLTDFYLSVDTRQENGPDTADFGLIFREDEDSNFYYFGISDGGEYVLYMLYGEWSTLIDWTKTELIQSGRSNRITVIGEGSHFIFFINDQYLTEFTDDSIPEGLTALAVELSEEGDQGVFEFDNFELRKP